MSRFARDPYGRLVRVYVVLERALFGPILQRARTRWIGSVREDAGTMLLVGDGDGRFAASLSSAVGGHQLVLVDRSWALLRSAWSRLEGSQGASSGARAVLCDVRRLPFREECCSVLCTHFVLDQWQETALDEVVVQLGRLVRPGGAWLVSDFARPSRGPGRLLAWWLLPLLYAFFRRVARIAASRLEDPTPRIRDRGFRLCRRATWLAGFVASELWRRNESPAAAKHRSHA